VFSDHTSSLAVTLWLFREVSLPHKLRQARTRAIGREQ
jgi:hypothetical protein